MFGTRSTGAKTARRLTSAALAATAAAAIGLLTSTSAASAAPATRVVSQRSGVVDMPVSFSVRNVNRSAVPCASDGKTYVERGNLIAPASVLHAGVGSRQITLYLHGLSFGEFFWHFRAVSGYDYARHQAEAGQASLILDRLGYGRSGQPVGTAICVGARADIAHQEIQALRSGHYSYGMSATATAAPRFGRVVLAGHSYGGQIAQVEAYSFGDINGLIVISYSDVVQSALLRANAAYATKVCAHGGVAVVPNGPGGYAPFGPPAKAPSALFHSVSPAVLKAAKPKLTLDPCGDTASFPAAVKVDLTDVSQIHVPVLLVAGTSDALFPPPAVAKEATLYTGTRHLSAKTVAASAHAVTLESTRFVFDRVVLTWLRGQR